MHWPLPAELSQAGQVLECPLEDGDEEAMLKTAALGADTADISGSMVCCNLELWKSGTLLQFGTRSHKQINHLLL